MKKDLRYFMREAKEEIVTAPAPEGFVDENGNPLQLEIRVLPYARIQEINDKYRSRAIATDNKGQPYIAMGEVVFKTDKDNARASRHIIAEALAYPDLQDPKLMEFYHCMDVSEMPLKVFPHADEFAHVNRVVMAALGLGGSIAEESPEKEIQDAKN